MQAVVRDPTMKTSRRVDYYYFTPPSQNAKKLRSLPQVQTHVQQWHAVDGGLPVGEPVGEPDSHMDGAAEEEPVQDADGGDEGSGDMAAEGGDEESGDQASEGVGLADADALEAAGALAALATAGPEAPGTPENEGPAREELESGEGAQSVLPQPEDDGGGGLSAEPGANSADPVARLVAGAVAQVVKQHEAQEEGAQSVLPHPEGEGGGGLLAEPVANSADPVAELLAGMVAQVAKQHEAQEEARD